MPYKAGTEFYRSYVIIIIPETMDQLHLLTPGLGHDLPLNLNLVTLEPWWSSEEASTAQKKFFLLRLEHLFQVGEHPDWSADTDIDIGLLLSTLGNVSTKNYRCLFSTQDFKIIH